jgi:hypothetical protein
MHATPELTLATLQGDDGSWAMIRPLKSDPKIYRVVGSNCGLKSGLVVRAKDPVHINDAGEPSGKARTRVRPQDLCVNYLGLFLPFETYCLSRFFTVHLRTYGEAALLRLAERMAPGTWSRYRAA